MRPLAAFFTQPARRYRDHQLVFALLALNFLVPAFSYSFFPEQAVRSFLDVNELLGGAPYTFPEAESRVWRYLGAANVMTLGFMCTMLLVNLRRFFMVLWPLSFMKAYAATSWLVGWLFEPGARFFLAAAVLDYVTTFAFLFFSIRAHREIATIPDDQLVPRPLFSRPQERHEATGANAS